MQPDLSLARETIAATFLSNGVCEIRVEATGKGVLDRETRTVTVPAPVVVYSGPCSLAPPSGTAQVVEDSTNADAVNERVRVKVPFTTEGIEPGMLLKVLSAEHTDLVGEEFRIVRVLGRTTALTRSLVCADQNLLPGAGG